MRATKEKRSVYVFSNLFLLVACLGFCPSFSWASVLSTPSAFFLEGPLDDQAVTSSKPHYGVATFSVGIEHRFEGHEAYEGQGFSSLFVLETARGHLVARMYDPADGRFISRDPKGFVDGYNLHANYFMLTYVDPSGLECELGTAENVRASGVTLQSFRIAGNPSTGDEALASVLNLEVFQKALGVIDGTGAGAVESVTDAISDVIDSGGFPSAGALAEGIQDIWDGLNSGNHADFRTMWVKVSGDCCVSSRFWWLGCPNYPETKSIWYRCDEAGTFDMKEPRAASNVASQMSNNLPKCIANAAVTFKCD